MIGTCTFQALSQAHKCHYKCIYGKVDGKHRRSESETKRVKTENHNFFCPPQKKQMNECRLIVAWNKGIGLSSNKKKNEKCKWKSARYQSPEKNRLFYCPITDCKLSTLCRDKEVDKKMFWISNWNHFPDAWRPMISFRILYL